MLADEQTAQRLDITGVPFFLAGGAVALSGAHEPDLLRRSSPRARGWTRPGLT